MQIEDINTLLLGGKFTEVVNLITNKNFRHKYYESTKKQAYDGFSVVTGEHQVDYIVRLKPEWNERGNYKPNERHKAEMMHIKKLYHTRTKAAYEKIKGYFERVFRVDKKANNITPKEEGINIDTILFEVDNFGGMNMVNYLETKYLFQNGYDPNAWLILDTDFVGDRTRIKPIIIPSKDALNFNYNLGILEWLVVQSGIKTSSGELEEYFVYIPGFKYRIVENGQGAPDDAKIDSILVRSKDDKEYFITVQQYAPENKIPAIRWGYMPNPDTKGETFAWFWDAAKFHMKDLIDRKAQLDVSYMLHTFLQKFQYVEKCTYHSEGERCEGGYMTGSGSVCPSCKGSGKVVHKDATDLIELAMPEEGEAPPLKPSDIAFYLTLPMDIVKLQQEQVDDLPKKATEAVFGVDVDRAGQGITTATEISNSYNMAYDKLNPFATGLVHIFHFVFNCSANMLGVSTDTVQANLAYPNEFDLESEGELILLFEKAKNAGLPSALTKNIELRIANKQNKGNKQVVDLNNAIEQFKPYSHLSTEMVETKLASLDETNKFRVAYEYFDKIARDIVHEMPNFHLAPYVIQKDTFESLINRYIAIVKEQQEATRDEFREEMQSVINDETEI